MQIKEIIARNVGGKDFQHQLGPVNIIIGPNASGKTAISNAIKTGLFGYLPRLGKQPGATYKLAGENRNEMNIALRFESKKGPDYLGSMTAHTWKRDSKGSISFNSDNSLSVPVVLLDTRDYFQRTAADRIKFIFDKIDPASYGWKDEQLTGKLSQIEVIPASIGNLGVQELISVVQDSIAYRNSTSQSMPAWFESLAEKLKDKRKENDAEWKRLQPGGIRKSLPAFKPQDNSGRILELEKLLADLRKEIAGEESTTENWNRNASRRQTLESQLLVDKSWTDNRSDLQKQIESLDVIVKGNKSSTHEIVKEFALEKARFNQIKQQISENLAAIKEKEDKLIAVLQSHSCPFCKSDKVGWQDDIQTEYQSDLEKLHETKATLLASRKECEARGSDLKARQVKSQETDLKASKDLNTLETLQKALQESEKIAGDINSRQAELNGLNASAAKPDTAKLAGLNQKLESLQGEYAGAQKLKQEFDYYLSVKDKADEAERLYTEKFTFAEVYRIALKETLAVQARLVTLAFCNILDKATALTDGLLRARLDYRDGELGMMLPEGWVSHETFSGWEEMLAYSGLSVALAQESPIKIVIMDELGRIDPANKKKLIQRLDELTKSGVIDQFIGIDVSSKDYSEIGVFGVTFINP